VAAGKSAMSAEQPKVIERIITEGDLEEAMTTTTKQILKTELLDQTRKVTMDVVRGLLTSPIFAQAVREVVKEAALDVVREILAEDMPDLENRVRKIVIENWEKSVSAAAHATLDTHLQAIRRKLGS
jgi:hypothetical protein